MFGWGKTGKISANNLYIRKSVLISQKHQHNLAGKGGEIGVRAQESFFESLKKTEEEKR
jgi:hypothetical protein